MGGNGGVRMTGCCPGRTGCRVSACTDQPRSQVCRLFLLLVFTHTHTHTHTGAWLVIVWPMVQRIRGHHKREVGHDEQAHGTGVSWTSAAGPAQNGTDNRGNHQHCTTGNALDRHHPVHQAVCIPRCCSKQHQCFMPPLGTETCVRSRRSSQTTCLPWGCSGQSFFGTGQLGVLPQTTHKAHGSARSCHASL